MEDSPSLQLLCKHNIEVVFFIYIPYVLTEQLAALTMIMQAALKKKTPRIGMVSLVKANRKPCTTRVVHGLYLRGMMMQLLLTISVLLFFTYVFAYLLYIFIYTW